MFIKNGSFLSSYMYKFQIFTILTRKSICLMFFGIASFALNESPIVIGIAMLPPIGVTLNIADVTCTVSPSVPLNLNSIVSPGDIENGTEPVHVNGENILY